jgi:replication-associated recombination protein RarA
MSSAIKEVRRGNLEKAIFWAYQMMISGSESEAFLWKNLRICALEDIGFANPQAIVVVNQVKELYDSLESKSPEKFLCGAYAAAYLANCRKTRYTTEIFQDVVGRLHEGKLMPEIPDYALDIHLPHGRAKGRDLFHYLTEGAKLRNEDKSFSSKYKKRLIKKAKKISRKIL